jgi:hypothetical protein
VKVVYLYNDGTKKISGTNVFTACSQLDAYFLLLDIIETEIDSGYKKYTDTQVKDIFSSESFDLHDGDHVAIADWNGQGDPVEAANYHFQGGKKKCSRSRKLA